MTESVKPNKVIWAVAGGKGGTGKSFLAASLAVALGSRTGDAIAIDADLGGPNLHTLLESRNGAHDLGDFVKSKLPKLEDAAGPTAHAGLRLVRGSDSGLFLTNLGHARKLKLIRHVRNLRAAGVVIDLGTGNAYNTLDLFLIAKPGIMVVTPEPTAVENAYFFLRSCAGRILKMYAQYYRMNREADRLARGLDDGARNLRVFLEELKAAGGHEARVLLAALKNFRPALIVNKARTDDDFRLGRAMAGVANRYFFIDLEVLETVPYDERIRWSLLKRVPFTTEFPGSPAARAIAASVDRLLAASADDKSAEAPFQAG